MDCSLPGSSIRGILQAGILEWFAISFSRRSSQSRDWTWVSRIVGRRFTIWATKEVRMSDSSWVTTQLRLSGYRTVIITYDTVIVQFFCVFLPPLLNLFCVCYILIVCPLSCPSLHKMFPWTFQSSWRDLLSFPFNCFLLLLCIVFWRKPSYPSLLFSGTLHSVGYIFPFLPCFSLLFFPQLFVKPPQKTTLHTCISFSWGWSWSLPPVQCYEPPSIVLEALCLPDPLNLFNTFTE